MKLCVLFISTLGLVVSINASADEIKVQSNAQSSAAQQVNQQAADSSKAAESNQTEGKVSHQHDVLKTQFLGKRPYMEIKTK